MAVGLPSTEAKRQMYALADTYDKLAWRAAQPTNSPAWVLRGERPRSAVAAADRPPRGPDRVCE